MAGIHVFATGSIAEMTMNDASQRCWFALLLFLATGATSPALGQTAAQFAEARKRLVEEILVPSGDLKNQRVLQSVRDTPRHEFIAPQYRRQAYFDMGIPIGESQTISSPYIVAFMTQAIDPQPTDKVLEIGTGSGYQAAILSPLVEKVYSIEIVEPLAKSAEKTLKRLQYKNVFTKAGDGYLGWKEHAPFDKIIVTCSPEKVPQPLVDQLKEGGLMVVPVGERYQQTLYLLRKKEGKLETEALQPTLFVPMTGKSEAARVVKPDPLNPKVVNGDFEGEPDAAGFLPGWYYQRQQLRVEDTLSPEGKYHARFVNRSAGLDSRLVQGFAVDGKAIGALEITASIKYKDVIPGTERDMLPKILVTFFDPNRTQQATQWAGPWHGTADWNKVTKRIIVPATAREGIIRIGLFGGVGEFSIDNLQIKAIPR